MRREPLSSSTDPLSPRLTSRFNTDRRRMPLLPLCGKQLRLHPPSASGRPSSVIGENGIRLFQD